MSYFKDQNSRHTGHSSETENVKNNISIFFVKKLTMPLDSASIKTYVTVPNFVKKYLMCHFMIIKKIISFAYQVICYINT